MKLWDVLATCLLLLSSVATRPLYQNTQPTRRTNFPRSYRDSVSLSVEEPLFQREDHSLQDISMDDQYDTAGPYPEQFEDVMDLIEAAIGRLRRSSETSSNSKGRRQQRQRGAANTRGTRGEGRGHGVKRRSRGRGGGRAGKGGRGEKGKEKTWVQSRGCLLKEIYLNVTDLGLGHRTKEALIFRYCSGPCSEAETNYDKILMNLTHKKKLDNDAPSRTCCRPIAFDDDLSFLDDDLVYHTLKKHSARKCACV
ncbi:glial cell line-derived neurotrophic factor isoform X2 [Melanotaenia boesemani]|nr:glial cell line-derived neurotrophic factor isoform X2 [Melanotaenia boesemani]